MRTTPMQPSSWEAVARRRPVCRPVTIPRHNCVRCPSWAPLGRSVPRLRRNCTAPMASGVCRRRTSQGHPVWPNRDPRAEKGGLNLYTAMRNSPVGAHDPLGLNPLTSVLKCAGAMGLAYAACQSGEAVACASAIAYAVAVCAEALTECDDFLMPAFGGHQRGPVWTDPSMGNAPPAHVIGPIYVPPTNRPPEVEDPMPITPPANLL